jgi:hypothetical protein
LAGADALLPQMTANLLIADCAFDADRRVLDPLAAAGKSAVIPLDQTAWRRANSIENATKSATSSRISSATQAVPGDRNPL